MDGEITRGPVPRWQKKLDMSSSMLNNSSMNTSKAKLSVSYNNGYNANANANANSNSGNKTPNKGITAEGKKTPSGKSPGK